MSRHNIVGSEAFNRAPFVYIRNVNRRRRMGALAIAASATVGAAAVGALGFLAVVLTQTLGGA